MGTVVVVDIAGSVELSRAEPAAGIELLFSYMNMASELVRASDGTVVTRVGDGLVAVFPTPTQALNFAVKMHKRVRDFNEKHRPQREINIKVGLATGELVSSRSDVYGTTVNLAARLSQAGEAGQILCDEATVNLSDRQVSSLLQTERTVRGLGKIPVYLLSEKARRFQIVSGKQGRGMTKEDLVIATAKVSGVPKAQAVRAVDAFLGAIRQSLTRGKKVSLVGFGTFAVARRAARAARSPRTRDIIKIRAARVPRFKASKALKAAIEVGSEDREKDKGVESFP